MTTETDLRVECVELEKCLLVTVVGEAGVAASAKMEREFTRIVARRPPVVVLDLTGLSFISSLGMGALVGLQRGITGRGGKLRVAGMQDRVAEALRRAQLDRVMVFSPSVQEAIAEA